jgi:hypothetical protein
VKKRGFETCADCEEYPCARFDKESSGLDSFVSHRKVFSNLNDIRAGGLPFFIEKQRIRIDILENFLAHFDDGRSKSFYRLACTLLPIDQLIDCQQNMKTTADSLDAKQRCEMLRNRLQQVANDLNIELRLNNRSKLSQ